MAIPYITPPTLRGGIQIYGLIMIVALGAGALTAVASRRRFGLSGIDIAVLVPTAIGAALIGAHVYDVAMYQWEITGDDPAMWFQLMSGVSLFGALFAIAATAWIVGKLRGLALASVADLVALGCLVAMTIGRIGCALVHDHPGVPTDSAFGVDFPAASLRWFHLSAGRATTLRIHDVGLEELLALLAISGVVAVLLARRVRAGMMAAVATIGYAGIRFGLDFLRLPRTEPTHAGLTAGQWSCIVALILVTLALVRRSQAAGESGVRPQPSQVPR